MTLLYLCIKLRLEDKHCYIRKNYQSLNLCMERCTYIDLPSLSNYERNGVMPACLSISFKISKLFDWCFPLPLIFLSIFLLCCGVVIMLTCAILRRVWGKFVSLCQFFCVYIFALCIQARIKWWIQPYRLDLELEMLFEFGSLRARLDLWKHEFNVYM